MKQSIKFTKMQGLGNDFIFVEPSEIEGIDAFELAKKMCDRNFGIGADGLVVVNPEDMQTPDTQASWLFINADGTQAQMCGNAIRCFAKYLIKNNLVKGNTFKVNTLAGVIIPEILDNGEVRVNMGKPILEAPKVPVDLVGMVLNKEVEVKSRNFNINAVSMGNPHCIIFEDDDTKKLALEYGPILEKHELFPEKTNVEFVRIVDRKNVVLDVWERGCGITLACGTGSCAAVVAGILNNLTENNVDVELPGGVLNIDWQGSLEDLDKDVYMSGPAKFVFEGNYLL